MNYLELIEYLYCENTDLTKDTAIGLLKLADEYSLPTLKRKCARYLARVLSKDNFVEFANVASMYQAKELQNSILNYLISYKSALFEHVDIKDLPRDLLEVYILKHANES